MFCSSTPSCRVHTVFAIVLGTWCLFTPATALHAPVAGDRLRFTSARPMKRTGGAIAAGLRLRGGGGSIPLPMSPQTLYNAYFGGLAVACTGVRLAARTSAEVKEEDKPSEGFKKLQSLFLPVFWAFKLADWLHGPYFYQVYASKAINGEKMGHAMISRLFLCGFGSSMILGTVAGSLVDAIGRKAGCMAFAVLYALSALTTRANSLWVLAAGRVLGGVATSLLFSAPEAWLVGENQKRGFEGRWLGECFSWAYFGDGLAAILAGYLAETAAGRKAAPGGWLSGPSAPFELSIVFLAFGFVYVSTMWTENYGGVEAKAGEAKESAGFGKALSEGAAKIFGDRRILLTGLVQALFEGAMYIFVLQWPPALQAILGGHAGGVPFGTVFSCLLTSCMVGSSAFSLLLKYGIRVETGMSVMLGLAAASLSLASFIISQPTLPHRVHLLSLAFFLFEGCVGLYFPAIGTLRSKYVPDSHKGSIINIFRLPLNLIVISTNLCIQRLGIQGALQLSAAILLLACLAQLQLRAIPEETGSEEAA